MKEFNTSFHKQGHYYLHPDNECLNLLVIYNTDKPFEHLRVFENHCSKLFILLHALVIIHTPPQGSLNSIIAGCVRANNR